jgi:hypothetical protein
MNIRKATFSQFYPLALSLFLLLKGLSLKENHVKQKKSPMRKRQKMERRGKRRKKRKD